MSDAPLMLSVSGLRGLVGQSLTPAVAARYAAAFGQWLRTQPFAPMHPHVVIGRDSRPSGQMLQMAASAGLVAVGCKVTHLDILSTPGVAIMAKTLDAQGGIVITASHNPIIWNGLKALRHDGTAPPPDQAQTIIDLFNRDDIQYAPVTDLQPTSHHDQAAAIHRDAILPHIDVPAIRRAKLRVLVDSVHGAGGLEARLLLEHLGVEFVHLYAEPTGLFPHPPEPTEQNLAPISADVARHRVHVAFAQDPDADRLALLDETGRYIGEEYTLALCALHRLKQGDRIVANLSTSRMLDDIAAAAGASVIRTPVGEANVAAAMRAHHATLGGEGNGGVIFAPVSHVRDSLVGMALILEMLAQRNQPLSQIVSTIPAYAIVKDKAPVDPTLLRQLAPRMQQHFPSEKIDLQDGVRVDYPDRWVHVRPSNTEPIIRIIAEAKSEAQAVALINEVKKTVGL
jgi:phosphomannomutase